MKTRCIFLISLILFSFSRKESLEKQLSKQLDVWHLAAAEANFEAYFNAVSADFIFLGTAPHERWDKVAFMHFSKPYFDAGKAWSFTSSNKKFKVLQKNKLVVFDEELDTWMKGCRGSGIFVKEKGKWKLSYYNLTVLIENEKIDAFIKLREE